MTPSVLLVLVALAAASCAAEAAPAAPRATDANAAGSHAKRMHDLANDVSKRVASGMASPADADAAAYFAAEADVWVKSPPSDVR